MDIVEKLRSLVEEWWECCGDIHEPLAEAADEIERLREILRKIKWDIDQAQWPEELCLHWIDGVNAALQPNEAQILATNTYEAEGRN